MTSQSPVLVISAGEIHLSGTAAMHVTELPHGLFPRLGRRFVRRWHRAHLGSEHGIVLVAYDDGAVAGFLLGTTDRRANVAQIMTRHRRELAVSGALAMLRRPWLIASFLRTRGKRYARKLLKPGGSSDAVSRAARAGSGQDEQVAVLEAVVVHYPYRGRGIGSALVDAFLADVAAAGVDRVELVTKADARGAAGFYERRGWQRVGQHVDRDGDAVLTLRIAPSAAGVR